MSHFIRARRSDQKKVRLEEVKKAAETLFSSSNYHQISMSAIANELDWSRGNLYRYATSKEEIFLEIIKDKGEAYFEALKTVFIPEANFSPETIAQIWTGIIYSHLDYFKYAELLPSIIETNVPFEKLVDFKRDVYERLYDVGEKIGECLNISKEEGYELIMTVHYHTTGFNSHCHKTPVVKRALEEAKVKEPPIDFMDKTKRFITMCLKEYNQKEN